MTYNVFSGTLKPYSINQPGVHKSKKETRPQERTITSSAAHPDNDLVREMSGDQILRVAAVSTQRHHQLEVSLVGVRLSSFTHVVQRGLAEVQATDNHLRYVLCTQANPSTSRQSATVLGRIAVLCK